MQSHQMKRAAGNSAPTDPDFKQVTLLLHGDGTNGGQNNTFIDGSTNNFTITRNGNVAQGTFSPYSQPDGRWSNYFDSNGDYLTLVYTTALQFTADFTIECWVYPVSRVTSFPCIVNNYSSFTTNGGFAIFAGHNSANTLKYNVAFNGTFPAIESTNNIIYNAWSHLALVRSGSTITLYVNGTSEGTATSSATVTGTANNWWIGAAGDSVTTSYFYGYISNLRALKGTALYTANFTPPTSPLTAITNTSLLTCQSNRFVDNSSNAFAITKNGDAATAAFSPFAPEAAYVSSVNGGSGYFDGNADKISAASNAAFVMGSGDFTVEAWCYQTGKTDPYPRLIHFGPFWQNNDAWGVCPRDLSYPTKITFISYKLGGRVLISSSDFKLNAWNHVVVTRASGVFRLFVNGILEATNSSFVGTSIESSSTNSVCVGSAIDNSNEEDFAGYITDVRVIKGSVVSAYSTSSTTIGASIFTPPTSPITAVSNTNLLLNCTNGAVVDNAAKNDIETVGNAQVSTTQAKFGTGSLYFDGTGDWLVIRDQPYLRFGTGNFTIEFWVYLASGDTGSNRGLVAKGGASTGWLVSLNTTEKVVFTYTTSTITSTGSITTNAWNHIAIVREGTGTNQTKIYIGGSNDGTGTVSTDFTQTESMYVGADRSAASPMKGYIDDVRITTGVARYTANFTPPTRAFPDK